MVTHHSCYGDNEYGRDYSIALLRISCHGNPRLELTNIVDTCREADSESDYSTARYYHHGYTVPAACSLII